eukprot:scaffold64415_cov36-Phaeocystis_antarctica.AAC.1
MPRLVWPQEASEALMGHRHTLKCRPSVKSPKTPNPSRAADVAQADTDTYTTRGLRRAHVPRRVSHSVFGVDTVDRVKYLVTCGRPTAARAASPHGIVL